MKNIPCQLDTEQRGWKYGKKKLGAACEYCMILVMMGDAQRVPPCGWEYPTIKFSSELQKWCKVMGLVIVKSTSAFTAS